MKKLRKICRTLFYAKCPSCKKGRLVPDYIEYFCSYKKKVIYTCDECGKKYV